MEDVFRGLSKTFQHMVNHDIPSEEVEEMMFNMKKEKEKLVIIRTIIPTKLNLYHNLAAQLVSINESRKEMYGWCNKTNSFIDSCSYPIHGSLNYFTEQLNKYKVISGSLIKIKSQYQSMKKVCDTIFNNLKGNEAIDQTNLSNSLVDLNNTFEKTTNKLENIETTIQEGIRTWDNYNSSKHCIDLKLNEAKQLTHLGAQRELIMEGSEKFNEIENLFKLHKNHFKLLERFLDQEDNEVIYEEFGKLQNEWQELLQSNDISKIKSVFDIAERYTHVYTLFTFLT